MKLSKVLAIVVSAHTCVVALILLQPGCQSQSARSASSSGQQSVSRPLPVANAGDAQNRAIVHRNLVSQVPVPAAEIELEKPMAKRYEPSRPIQQWNVIDESEPEVIAGHDYVDHGSLADFNPRVEPLDPAVLEPVNSGTLEPGLSGGSTATYTVVKGDNLTKIARSYGIGLSELMHANSLNKKSILRIGQQLVIPNPQPGLNPEPPVAPTYEASSAEVESTLYIVVPGDSLSRIAAKFSTTVRAIKSANGLSSDRIYAGQDLLIPKSSPTSSASSLNAIPEQDTHDVGMTYKVRKGDTLGKIAQRFGVRVGDIMLANGISDPRHLRADQTIKIPVAADSDNKPSTPATLAPRVDNPLLQQSAPPLGPVLAPKSEPAVTNPYLVAPLDEIDLDDVPYVPVYNK